MKTLLTTAAALIALAAPAFAECEAENVTVGITTEAPELNEVVCDAALAAVDFFRDLGYKDQLDLHIVVQDEVLTRMWDATKNDWADEYLRVFGEYNARENTNRISTYGTDYMESRHAWLTDPQDYQSGLEIDVETWASVVTHETAHQILQILWDARNSNLRANEMWIGHGIHEYVAYNVQIASLSEEARAEVLAQYPDAQPFMYRENLNGIRHFAHPHQFGVQAYLTYNAEWVHDIINGRMVTFDLSF